MYVCIGRRSSHAARAGGQRLPLPAPRRGTHVRARVLLVASVLAVSLAEVVVGVARIVAAGHIARVETRAEPAVVSCRPVVAALGVHLPRKAARARAPRRRALAAAGVRLVAFVRGRRAGREIAEGQAVAVKVVDAGAWVVAARHGAGRWTPAGRATPNSGSGSSAWFSASGLGFRV